MKNNIILLFISICFSLLLGEILIRYAENQVIRNDPRKVQYETYKKIYSDLRDSKPYLYFHFPNINVKLENGFYDFTFITNSEGLREVNDYNEIEKSVIYLGDSIIEGASLENHETLDSHFENITGITSLNFGLGSANTIQEYHLLKDKYKSSYNTKLVVLGFCLNDLPHNKITKYFDPNVGNWKVYDFYEEPTITGIVKSFIKKSKLILFVYNAINQKNHEAAANDRFSAKNYKKEAVDNTELYLNKISEFCKLIGSEFIVVIFPYESQLKNEKILKNQAQDVLKTILKKNNIDYIDLYEPLHFQYNNNKSIRWYHDDCHPYKEGTKFIAEYLSEKLPDFFPTLF
jgi:hypothetical protein